MGEMKQVIYRSQPFGFEKAMLSGILLQARRNNPRDEITGALICRHDIYLQLIEGPADKIDALYTLISADNRHTNIAMLLSSEVSERMFPDWAMFDCETPVVTWSAEEVEQGALDNAEPEALLNVFARLAAKANQGK